MWPGRAGNLAALSYPVIASPDIQGIGCITMPPLEKSDAQCFPVTRNLKALSNRYVNKQLAKHCMPGLEGELSVGKTPADNHSAFMNLDGAAVFTYHVFDFLYTFNDPDWFWGVKEPYEERFARLEMAVARLPSFVKIVPIYLCKNPHQLEEFLAESLAKGYKGICIRAPGSPYKFGEVTTRQQWFLKYKPEVKGEARVIGYRPIRLNANKVKIDKLGYAYRPMYRTKLIPTEALGVLIVQSDEFPTPFKVGSGWSRLERAELWQKRDSLIGRIIEYRHLPHIRDGLPRGAIFVRFKETETQENVNL